jgi:hypothetical protein
MIKLLTIITLAFSLNSNAMEKIPLIKKEAAENDTVKVKDLIELLTPPIELTRQIKKNLNLFSNRENNEFSFGENKFYVKNDTNRAFNAAILKYYINNKWHFKHIDVPKKYIVKVGGRSYCFSEFIEDTRLGKISKEEAEELLILVKETGFSDFGLEYLSNLKRRTSDNKLILIDTENESFKNYDSTVKGYYNVKSVVNNLWNTIYYARRWSEDGYNYVKEHLNNLDEDTYRPLFFNRNVSTSLKKRVSSLEIHANFY